jgi:hypothetical protein
MPKAVDASATEREFALGGQTVLLDREELERLLQRLALLDLPAAAGVADDIEALRLAGGPIRLLPTEAELAALRLAITAIAHAEGPMPASLLRLRAVCEPRQ